MHLQVCARSLLLMLGAASVLNSPVVLAQAFADAGAALVDYSKAEVAPGTSCESLGAYKAKDIVSLHAAVIPATGAVGEQCHGLPH